MADRGASFPGQLIACFLGINIFNNFNIHQSDGEIYLHIPPWQSFEIKLLRFNKYFKLMKIVFGISSSYVSYIYLT